MEILIIKNNENVYEKEIDIKKVKRNLLIICVGATFITLTISYSCYAGEFTEQLADEFQKYNTYKYIKDRTDNFINFFQDNKQTFIEIKEIFKERGFKPF